MIPMERARNDVERRVVMRWKVGERRVARRVRMERERV
jgi:hypothetical protein